MQFKLEDATKDTETPSTPSFLRRPTPVTNPPPRPASNPVETAEATITLPLRRPKSQDNKGNPIYRKSHSLNLYRCN